MTDKIDFPLNVELPLRNGDTCELYQFAHGRYWGMRRTKGNDLVAQSWEPSGYWAYESKFPTDFDILPPKRRVWIKWGISMQFIDDFTFEKCTADIWISKGHKVSEIEEP